MKQKLAALGLISALLLAALFVANTRRKETPVYLLRQYPRSANLDGIIEHHLRPAPNMVFYGDWFDSGDTASSKGCGIDQSGARTCAIYSGNRLQATSASAIPPARLAPFQKALRELPPGETVAPPLSRLLVVSFHDGVHWTTRLYDRTHLPRQFFRIYEFHIFKTIPEH